MNESESPGVEPGLFSCWFVGESGRGVDRLPQRRRDTEIGLG